MARKRGAIIKSRNKKVIQKNPIRTTCPYCGNINQHEVINEQCEENELINEEKFSKNTTIYWCEKCGWEYLQGLKNIEYHYS